MCFLGLSHLSTHPPDALHRRLLAAWAWPTLRQQAAWAAAILLCPCFTGSRTRDSGEMSVDSRTARPDAHLKLPSHCKSTLGLLGCRSRLQQEAGEHFLNSHPALWREEEITGKLFKDSELGTVDKAFAAVRAPAAMQGRRCLPVLSAVSALQHMPPDGVVPANSSGRCVT